MQFKLACADFTFPLLSHENALDLIAMLGFDGVDIGLFEGRSHLQPSREFRQLGRAAKRLRGALSDRGLTAADVFLQVAPDFHAVAINHPLAPARRAARDWFLRTLDYAAGCGAKHVTTLPGVHFAGERRADSWRRMCDELAWRLDQAQPLAIRFGVEAHLGSIVSSPARAQKMIADVPGLTLTLDYTHFTRQGRPDAEIEPLVALAGHLHVRGAARGRLQTSFDENAIDYARVCRQLHATDYCGWLGIEYVWTEWEQCNRVDNLSETIRWRDYFRSLPPGAGNP
jgi:sugar phosphate isomerase/epimerase